MIEQPKYIVIKKEGRIELRHYEAFTMVEALDEDIDSVKGFRLVFDYIQGNNTNKQKIAMTVPVINQLQEKQVKTTAFVMPVKVSQTAVPIPNRSDLSIVEVPARFVVSIAFSMNPSMPRVLSREQELLTWIHQQGYRIIGKTQVARYNPPFIPSFLKRNELWVEIETPH